VQSYNYRSRQLNWTDQIPNSRVPSIILDQAEAREEPQKLALRLFLYARSSALFETRLVEDARFVGDYEILFRDQNDCVLGRVRRSYAGSCEKLISFDAPRAMVVPSSAGNIVQLPSPLYR
jgi:hypothetical protein